MLARSRDPESGKSVLEQRRTTCLTKPMERTAYFISFWKLGKYYRTYPAYVEDEVRAALLGPDAQYTRGPSALTKRTARSEP